jgi:hypothetical protein
LRPETHSRASRHVVKILWHLEVGDPVPLIEFSDELRDAGVDRGPEPHFAPRLPLALPVELDPGAEQPELRRRVATEFLYDRL